MTHLTSSELYDILNEEVFPDEETPRTPEQEHLEVCEKCQRELARMRKFFEDIEKERVRE